jgi:DNA polymerase-3 subunit delta
MKADRGQIARGVAAPAGHGLFLLYGPDESGSRALARRVAAAMGAEAEQVELSGAELRGDPARLADEAASISLFGGARYVVIEPAGDECTAAVEALLETPSATNPVVLIAGALKGASRLLKLVLAHPNALAFASYPPEGQEADRLASEMGRAAGLILSPDVARRVADAAGGNRDLLEQELAKLALYLDAAADRPQPLEHEALDAVGADAGEADLSRLVDSVGNGDVEMLQEELLRLESEGVEGIPILRALLRRMTLLARLRAEVERGNSVDAVMASQGKSLFWKDKKSVSKQLGRWRSDLVARSIGRLLEAERQMKTSGALGAAAVDEELFAIARQAARLR